MDIRLKALSVHLFTATGAVFAMLAMLAAVEEKWPLMFGWLVVAFIVDGIDGPMARKIEIKRILPNWSGDVLDAVIDYATFVMIPAVGLYLSGLIGEPWSGVAAASLGVLGELQEKFGKKQHAHSK